MDQYQSRLSESLFCFDSLSIIFTPSDFQGYSWGEI